MSTPVESFECILKKHSTKKASALYRDSKHHTKHVYRPQDVLSNVSAQLKAIQTADISGYNKIVNKDIQKYKESTFLTVNNLPMYGEVPKQNINRFETQFASNTQLIDIVNNAELIDNHRGMTQEFETSFSHTGRHTINNIDKNSEACFDDAILVENKLIEEISDNWTDKNDDQKTNLENHSISKAVQDIERAPSSGCKDTKLNTKFTVDSKQNKGYVNICDGPFTTTTNEDMENDGSSNQILNECIDVYVNTENFTERSPSPVFVNKTVKNKSKSPSPLVFDLDKFESFAISMLENNEYFNAKHVIDSQILGKELHVKTNEDVELESKGAPQSSACNITKSPQNNLDNVCVTEKYCHYFNIQQPPVQCFNETKQTEPATPNNIEDKSNIDIICSQILPANVKKKPILQYKEDITDKTSNFIYPLVITEQAHNQIDIQDSPKVNQPKHGLLDEILFSSDEEDCNHKSYADLPFTCALEISTYNQSDVLDKTMYVGFQTASNRSIQISKDSLDKAKSMLRGVDNEETTVTELVQICDRSSRGDNADIKVGIVGKHKDNNCSIRVSEVENTCTLNEETKAVVNVPKLCNTVEGTNNIMNTPKITAENNNYYGFKTANNKRISLSDKGLVRCKKVFQDIDINEKFDSVRDNIDSKAKALTSNAGSNTIDEVNVKKFNKTELEELIQTDLNDDVIIQEFENIEMSLEEDKEDASLVESKSVSENREIKNDTILNSINMEDVLQSQENVELNNALPEMDYYLNSNTNVGFETASMKHIKISKNAITSTKNIFADIDYKDIDALKKANKHGQLNNTSHRENINHFGNILADNISGFKTANNKVINISKQALAKTDTIFKDIDSLDFEQFNEKTLYPVIKNVNQPSTSKAVFAGFKTGNNKNVNISETSIASVKTRFKDIVSSNMENSKNMLKMNVRSNVKPNNEDYKKLLTTSKTSLVGFKTANNKDIHISDEALKKTANIFDNIDSIDVTKHNDPLKADVTEKHTNKPNPESLNKLISSNTFFSGFKTANNKDISISDAALAKTKNIFNDIDSPEIEYTMINKIAINDGMRESINNHLDKPDKNCTFKTTAISEMLITNNRILGEDMFDIENVQDKVKLMPELGKFQGFKTASNKDVKISAEALSKTKNIFKDINMTNNCSYENADNHRNKTISKEESKKVKDFQPMFKGFHTASSKIVTISETALAKAKNIFKEIDPTVTIENIPANTFSVPENNKSEIVGRDGVVPVNNREFRGFQTANNKAVNISEEALAKSRQLFESIDKNNEQNSFKGFQTASNKKVEITNDALAKGKIVFQDILNNSVEKVNEEVKENVAEHKSTNFDFEPVNNAGISRSDVASTELDKIVIKNAKFTSVRNDIKSNTKVLEDIVIDTQILNNFEDTLYTEDFKISPVKPKRPGSPILSCPRAKRRKKFQTPYSQKTVETVAKIDSTVNTNSVNFIENYKRNKIYKLRDIQKFQDENSSIDPYLLNFSYDSLLQFEFYDKRSHLNSITTVTSLKQAFINSVNAKLIPDGWIDNHLKLILWKLISYEVKYPKSNIVCEVTNVINQLKYRYDKELYNAERPALRKILEKDDLASKPIVLCVVQVYEDGVKVNSVTNLNSNIELLVSDGWYCVKATIDRMLAKLVYDQKIVVGGKIVANGVELVNCEQGIAPWEDTSSVRLKLFGNSTRRARWDARLGYHSNAAILSQLSAVNIDGGKVSRLRVYVTRVYPALYVEKFEDGSTVTRSERLELLHQVKHESERHAMMEKLYEEVEKEFSDQESQDSEVLSDSGKRTRMDSGTQIAKLMKRSIDPVEFKALLTSSQTELLEHYTTKRQEKLLQNIHDRIREKMEKNGLMVTRNVVPVLKVRVAGVEDKNGAVQITKGMISIWKPNEGLYDIIKEGAWIDVVNVVPTAVRYSEIHMSAGRQSFFCHSKYKGHEKFISHTDLLKRKCYTIKELSENPAMTTDYNEVDTIGLVFYIEPSIQEFESMKQPFQNVYLTDADKNMISINFWGGLKKFGFENILDTGQVVSCANLQKRAGNTRKSIPQYRATEFSHFTKTPKNETARIALENLNKTFTNLDRRKFCNECVVLKNNYAVLKHYNNENISPYRPNNSDYNISKNKQFIDSPLTRRLEENFHLTGLDFESTFKQTDTENLPKELLLRKKRTNEKINKLKMYGEPPPLSPILILNKSVNATKSYKSPLISKLDDSNRESKNCPNLDTFDPSHSKSDSFNNVANVRNTPNKIAVTNNSATSPVLNRTYVKEINPVKLNFDDCNNIGDIDHFAEEFDDSPPLSLD